METVIGQMQWIQDEPGYFRLYLAFCGLMGNTPGLNLFLGLSWSDVELLLDIMSLGMQKCEKKGQLFEFCRKNLLSSVISHC